MELLHEGEFWVAVGFVLVILLLVWKGAPGMIARMLDARAAAIDAELEEARRLNAEAAALLNTLHSDFDFWVERIDIDQDPAIREKLNDHIPVVTINGGNRVSEPVTEEKLRRAFKKALKAELSDIETSAEDVTAVPA